MREWTNEELSIIEEYRQKNYTYYQIQEILKEAGFIRTYDSIKKVASKRLGRKDSVIPSKPLEEVIEKQVIHRGLQSHRVLAIGDIHAPFEHKYYLDFLVETYNNWNCDTVVCVGDEVDAHALSKYDPDPDGFSPGHELEQAINHLKPFYEAFPNVKVCTSNHTVRGFKKGFEAGIPSAFFRSYREILEAPIGWEWKDKWDIDGVNYIHLEGYSGYMGALKAAIDSHKSTVGGHLHSCGGVLYVQTEFYRNFGLQTGCGIDIEKYAFKYSRLDARKATLGCGVVIDGKEAYFIPMSGF